MTTTETIARLEALLERVRARSGEPRVRAPQTPPAVAAMPTALRAPAAAPAPVAPVALKAPVAPPPSPPIQVVQPAPSVIVADDPFAEADLPTRPPPRAEPPVVEIEVDIDVQEPIEERAAGPLGSFDGSPPPFPVREAFDSRERLVAADPAGGEPISEPAASAVAPAAEPLSAVAGRAGESARDVPREEEAPISSQRPVVPEPEHLAQMAFGAEESRPPRHTPPPESGRLPAAPEIDFDADVTGVRHAPAAMAPSAELEPQVIRGAVQASAAVADVVSKAQGFAPATFTELVDASLGL